MGSPSCRQDRERIGLRESVLGAGWCVDGHWEQDRMMCLPELGRTREESGLKGYLWDLRCI